MPATIIVQLDVAALNALFPEGSEARVSLTKGVVANFVNSSLSAAILTDEVREVVKAAKEGALSRVLQEVTSTSHSWGSPRLTDRLKEMFKDEAENAVKAAWSGAVSAAMDEKVKLAVATMQRDIEVRIKRIQDEEIRTTVREKISSAMKSVT